MYFSDALGAPKARAMQNPGFLAPGSMPSMVSGTKKPQTFGYLAVFGQASDTATKPCGSISTGLAPRANDEALQARTLVNEGVLGSSGPLGLKGAHLRGS